MKATFMLRAIDSQYWETKVPNGSNVSQSLKEQGYPALASCPKDMFEPDLSKLNAEQLDALTTLVSTLDASQTRIIAWLLISQDTLFKHDLKIGQKVYVNLSAPVSQYLDNYFRGTVIKSGPKVEGVQYVYVSCSLKDYAQTLVLVPVASIYNEEAFEKIKLKLIRKKLLKNPKPVVKNFKLEKENPVLAEIKEFLDKAKPVSELKTKKRKKSANKYEVE